jgi:hypothetical protein
MGKSSETRDAIIAECDALKEMLLSKNRAYGNSATDPVRIFSKANTEEQIRVRIDDKLSRIIRGELSGEDAELDLTGYLVLLRVVRRLAKVAAAEAATAADAKP